MAKAKLKVAQTTSALPQKFLRLQQLLSVIVLLALVTPVYPFNPTQLNEQERQEWEQLIQRFNQPQMFNLLAGKMWSLTHGGDSKKVQEILHLLTILDPRSGRRPGITTKEFKNRIAAFLESDDDQVAGFADVVAEVVELDLVFVVQLDQLVISGADGGVGHRTALLIVLMVRIVPREGVTLDAAGLAE